MGQPACLRHRYGLFAKTVRRQDDQLGRLPPGCSASRRRNACDNKKWNVLQREACQKKPQWTLLKNNGSYENVLGYSGTNSKYVRIIENAFFNNGAGIVPNTLDSEGTSRTAGT